MKSYLQRRTIPQCPLKSWDEVISRKGYMFETYPSWPIGRSHPQPTAREKEQAQNKLVEDKSNVQGFRIRLVLCQPGSYHLPAIHNPQANR